MKKVLLLILFAHFSLFIDLTHSEAVEPKDTPETKSLQVSQEQAEKLAIQHLALRNARWGKPTRFAEEAGNYIVFFQTPQQEARLIGERSLSVDKKTGLVKVRDRR